MKNDTESHSANRPTMVGDLQPCARGSAGVWELRGSTILRTLQKHALPG